MRKFGPYICCMDIFRRLFGTYMPVRNSTGIPEVRTERRREKYSEDHPRKTIDLGWSLPILLQFFGLKLKKFI